LSPRRTIQLGSKHSGAHRGLEHDDHRPELQVRDHHECVELGTPVTCSATNSTAAGSASRSSATSSSATSWTRSHAAIAAAPLQPLADPSPSPRRALEVASGRAQPARSASRLSPGPPPRWRPARRAHRGRARRPPPPTAAGEHVEVERRGHQLPGELGDHRGHQLEGDHRHRRRGRAARARRPTSPASHRATRSGPSRERHRPHRDR
jgi:hypothetical protein